MNSPDETPPAENLLAVLPEDAFTLDAGQPVYHLLAFGPVFSSRSRGTRVRAPLEALLEQHDELTIDFDGVVSFNYSFADEFLGRLATNLQGCSRPRLRVTGTTAAGARTLRACLARRGVAGRVEIA